MNIELTSKNYREEQDFNKKSKSVSKLNKEEQEEEEEEEKEDSLNQINEDLEKKYISRNELIKNLQFPRSTNKRIIVLPNNEGLGFRYDCYDESTLGQYLSEKEFRESVYELTKICSIQFAKKLKREKNDPFATEKKMLLLNIPMLAIAVLLFSLRVFDTVTNDYTFEIGVAFYGVGMLFIFYNFIKTQIRKPDMTSFEKSTYNELEKKIIEFNKQYSSRGIRWILHPKFYWIEIQIL
ncbi:hypothetical protein ABPG74_022247 [Tetrahymena malaccensis]